MIEENRYLHFTNLPMILPRVVACHVENMATNCR